MSISYAPVNKRWTAVLLVFFIWRYPERLAEVFLVDAFNRPVRVHDAIIALHDNRFATVDRDGVDGSNW
jgi:hypothetical protein